MLVDCVHGDANPMCAELGEFLSEVSEVTTFNGAALSHCGWIEEEDYWTGLEETRERSLGAVLVGKGEVWNAVAKVHA